MAGYTKLFESIIHSTIWREPPTTCKVWVTMLAMADKFGQVEASVPGLADAARVSIGEVEAALAAFMAPDAYSRTKAFEGRRVAEVDGGWVLLNHAKYREKMSADEVRERAKMRKRAERERKAAVAGGPPVTPGVTECHALSRVSRQSEAESEAKAEAESLSLSPPAGAAENGPAGPLQVRLADGVYSASGRWQVPSLIKALRCWAAHILSQRKPFGLVHLESLLIHHYSAGWTAERLERGIRLSLSKSTQTTIIDPDESRASAGGGSKSQVRGPVPMLKVD